MGSGKKGSKTAGNTANKQRENKSKKVPLVKSETPSNTNVTVSGDSRNLINFEQASQRRQTVTNNPNEPPASELNMSESEAEQR